MSPVVLGTFFCVFLLAAHPALTAVPPVGYRVSSMSTADYYIGANHFVETSNQVFTTIDPYFGVRLTPKGTISSPAYSLAGLEGDELFCSFLIENTGNVRDSMSVSSTLIPPSSIGVESVLLFHDADGDSTFDLGEDDPSSLVLDPAASVDLGVLVLLAEDGGGDSYFEIQATAGNDTIHRTDNSVFRVTTRAGPENTLHLGPAGNARAIPRGEGSPDDVSRRRVGLRTESVVFQNDVLNEDNRPDLIEIEPADSAGWPPGIDVSVTDTSGAPLLNSPRNNGGVLVGPLEDGEIRTVQVRVSAETGTFYDVIADSLSVRFRARSLVDSTRVNETIDRVILGTPINPAALLSIDQTFKENRASFGDIVTLVVSVTNMSDSVTVDDVGVSEFVQPALDYLSSPRFELDPSGSPGRLVWAVGSLSPGEKRETAIKFTVNGRMSKGETKVIGDTRGIALGREAYAGPVANVLYISNDMFSDDGFVFGDVFIDANGDGKRDPGEVGVSGAGVYVESGEYALTDSTGRFSLPYLFSGYRIVRIDESTLPPEVQPVPPTAGRRPAVSGKAEAVQYEAREAAGESSFDWTERIVHLVPTGHARVSFPLQVPPEAAEPVTRRVTCQERVAVEQSFKGLYQIPAIESSHFAVGKAYLKTELLGSLDPIWEFLARNPGWMVFLEGHTDNVPIHNSEFASNEELSAARAAAVMRYLNAKGVAETRLIAKGYGDKEPIADNSTRDGRARNRRVEVSFIPPGVGLDEQIGRDRVQADLRDVAAAADTVEVFLVWNFSTDSPYPLNVDLEFDIPPALGHGMIDVKCGDSNIRPAGSRASYTTSSAFPDTAGVPPADNHRYQVTGFTKSRGIECAMKFSTSTADTHLVRTITSKIDVSGESIRDPASSTSAPPGHSTKPPSPAARLRATRSTFNPLLVPAAPAASGASGKCVALPAVTLRPLENGDSKIGTQSFTLFSWTENEAAASHAGSVGWWGAAGEGRAGDVGNGGAGPAGAGAGRDERVGGNALRSGDAEAGRDERVGGDALGSGDAGAGAAAPGVDGTGTADGAGFDVANSQGKPMGLIAPPNGTIVSRRDQIEVVAKVPLGSSYTLSCDGTAVSEQNIGKKEIHLKAGFEEISYYGVKIKDGWNVIRLDARPVDGSESITDSITVALTGKPVVLQATPTRLLVPADGQARGVVWVELKDKLGLPAINGLVATVVEGDSLVANTDEDPGQRGLQITSRDGRFAIRVKPRARTGRERVVVETHGLQTSFLVAYVPTKRPMLLTGLLEGRFGIFNSTGRGSSLGLDDFYDGVDAGGDARFFIQGTAYAGINLTARIDAKKRYDDPVLKQLDPERQYPIYGDASRVYYAAPAQGGNYIALEKNQSFLRYGDFRSPLIQGEFLSYKRTATGISGGLVSGNSGLNAFITKTDFVTVRDEIEADGTSGYYFLEHSPIVENSLNLTIEIRDRFRPEKILEVRPLVEHRDYTVNYFNGAVLFKEPVPAYTAEFNPVRIIVIYETEAGDEKSYLYGLRGDVAEAGQFRLGATAVARDGGESDYALYGVDGGLAVGPLDFSGEIARSEDDITGNGTAYKFEVGTKKLMGEHSLYVRRVEGDFVNPSFTGGRFERFRKKAGFDSRLRFSRDLSLVSSGYTHRIADTGDEERSIDAVGIYDGPVFMFGAGARAANEKIDASDVSSLLSVFQGGIRMGGRLEFRTRWEQNLRDEVVTQYPNRLTSSLAVPFRDRYKIVVTDEILSGGSRPSTNQLLAGIETRIGRFSKVYSKYAMNRTASDERMGGIAGIKQQVPLGGGLMGSLDLEGYHSFSDRSEDEYVALKAGLSRLDRGESLLEGYYEYRWQSAASRHLLRGNALMQFDNGMAVFFKDALSFSFPDGRSTSIRNEGRIAGAYRPVVSPIHALCMLKTEYDRYSPIDPDAIVWKTVLSTDINLMPKPLHEFRVKLAVKYVEDYSLGISSSAGGHLVLGQYVYRFAKNWDMDLWGRYAGQGSVGTRQLGSGVEIGRTFYGRVRIAGGYSLNGFEDRDLSENEAWTNGFGVRVQLILSDWMFDGYQF